MAAEGRPVKFSLTADDRDLYNKLVKQEKQIARLQQKFRDLRREQKNHNDEGNAGFLQLGRGIEKVTLNATEMLTAIAGVGGAMGAINLLIGKYQEMIEKQKEAKRLAAETIITMDQARSAALINLPTSFAGGAKNLNEIAKRVSENSGMTMTDVYRNMGGPLSAMGSASPQDFEKALTLSLQIQRKTGGAVQSNLLAGSILDVMKSTGLNSVESALGYIRQIGAAARIQTLEGQLKLVPGLAIGRSLGDTPEMAAELQAAISQQIVDPEGSRTGVLYKGLATALYSDYLVPYQKTNLKTGKKETQYRKVTGQNTLERLQNLATIYQSLDENMKKELVSKLSERQIAFLLPALQGDTSFQRNLAAAQREITAPNNQSKIFTTDLLKNINGTPYASISDAEAARKQIEEKISIQNPVFAMQRQSDQLFKTISERTGRFNIADFVGLEPMMLKTVGRAFSGPGGGLGTRADAYAAFLAGNRNQFSAMSDEQYQKAIAEFQKLGRTERRFQFQYPVQATSEESFVNRAFDSVPMPLMERMVYGSAIRGLQGDVGGSISYPFEAIQKFGRDLAGIIDMINKKIKSDETKNPKSIDPNRQNMDN